MARCLTAPSLDLNQCWIIISEVLWHSSEGNFSGNFSDIYLDISLKNILSYDYRNKFQWNMNQNMKVSYFENVFELNGDVICKMSAMLFWPQYVLKYSLKPFFRAMFPIHTVCTALWHVWWDHPRQMCRYVHVCGGQGQHLEISKFLLTLCILNCAQKKKMSQHFMLFLYTCIGLGPVSISEKLSSVRSPNVSQAVRLVGKILWQTSCLLYLRAIWHSQPKYCFETLWDPMIRHLIEF